MMPAAGLGGGIVPLPNDEELKVSQSLTLLGELEGYYGIKVCKLPTITNHPKTHGSECLTQHHSCTLAPSGALSNFNQQVYLALMNSNQITALLCYGLILAPHWRPFLGPLFGKGVPELACWSSLVVADTL